MDTLTKIKNSKINNIIMVVLENILLEIYFNIEYQSERLSFKLCISNDGETILYTTANYWIELDDINYEIYAAIRVNENNSELLRLLGCEILNIYFGIGVTNDIKNNVIYYIKIETNKNEFLFFNNGDEGMYSFDRIEEILANDIYGYTWSEYV